MVFADLIFLYGFLPLNLICYALAPSLRAKNTVMIVFSMIFYSWAGPGFLLLLVGLVFVNWLLALGIGRARSRGAATALLVVSCVVSLGALCYFKYANFLVDNLRALGLAIQGFPEVLLPIGISFYTFQILSYTVDVYRKEVSPQTSFWKLLLYVSMFHQCIAGPIVRYQDISAEIDNRRVNGTEFSKGVTRFAIGLAKKALLANACARIADSILLADSVASDAARVAENAAALAGKPAAMLWLGVLVYMLQIYLDFSAYSDMAIGMGLMIGFHYRENFRYPYAAGSVTDFWRRWHISLSSFFRDYVYIPLGGNRKGLPRKLLNMLVVWFLTGLWHGASWNFVLWGLYFFVLLVIENLGWRKLLDKLPRFVGHLYLLIAVFFGWILFRFDRMELAVTVVKGLFCGNGNAFTDFSANTMWLNNVFFLIAAVLACTPLVHALHGRITQRAAASKGVAVVYGVWEVLAPLALLALATMALVGNSYNPFLYFRF